MPPFIDTATAEAIKNIPLLLEFTCRVCKRSKGKECFSKNETKNYQFKKVKNPRTDGVSALLRCRSCTGESVYELLCEGQCGLWKPLNQFSKTQRRNGSRWCEECILWKESLEPGHVTAAAPNAPLAPDEDDNIRGDAGNWSYDPEAGNSDDDDDDDVEEFPKFTSVPVQQYGELSLEDSDNTSGTSVFEAGRYGYIPPHLRAQSSSAIEEVIRSLQGVQRSSATTTRESEYIPPHLRGSSTTFKTSSESVPPYLRDDQRATTGTVTPFSNIPPHLRGTDIKSTSSVSNPFEASDSRKTAGQASAPQSTIQTGVIYNAYDNTGRPHVQQRIPSTSTLPSSGMTPSQDIPQPVVEARNRRGWAKPVGTRKPARQYIPRGRQQRNNNDSDESDDEM